MICFDPLVYWGSLGKIKPSDSSITRAQIQTDLIYTAFIENPLRRKIFLRKISQNEIGSEEKNFTENFRQNFDKKDKFSHGRA